jgi:hypothetical protein
MNGFSYHQLCCLVSIPHLIQMQLFLNLLNWLVTQLSSASLAIIRQMNIMIYMLEHMYELPRNSIRNHNPSFSNNPDRTNRDMGHGLVVCSLAQRPSKAPLTCLIRNWSTSSIHIETRCDGPISTHIRIYGSICSGVQKETAGFRSSV